MCDSTEEVTGILKQELQNIADIARKKAESEGYKYSVCAQLGEFYFPTKQYENLKLPAGNYEGLRVIIGEGEGENWWCVLYPQLCFVSSQNGVINKPQAQKLKKVLSEEEYTLITAPESGGNCVKIKFKLLELIKSKR